MPEIKKFEEKIVDFSIDIEKMQIIVRRFDEIISEKASKLDIEHVYQHIKGYVTNDDFNQFATVINEKA